MGLSTAAVTELTSEGAVYALAKEWLAGYFDGGSHAVGNNAPVSFPSAGIACGQGVATQPLEKGAGVEIRIVVLPRQELQESADTILYSGKLVTSYVLFNFWVSAKVGGPGQSQLMAELVGQLLKALLTNPATRYDLAIKGVTHLRPHAIQWIPSVDYAKRLVACSATVQYPVQFGDLVVTPPDGSGQPGVLIGLEEQIQFVQEDVLVAGLFLPGQYTWTQNRLLRSMQALALAPQVDPVVLGLVIGGEASGPTVTLPIGAADAEVSDSTALDILVPAGTPVRVQVLSGPPAEQSAWHCAVMVDTELK